MQITASTPVDTATIAGETFNVFKPFTAGDVLEAGEAAALNQVFAENIRNNFAKGVKEAKGAGTFDLAAFQASLDAYMNTYKFGERTGGGGRTTDPVASEAMEIARNAVSKSIVKQGMKLTDFSAKRISELAKEAIAANPQILELARKRVDEANQIAGVELDSLTPGEAPASKKAKAAA